MSRQSQPKIIEVSGNLDYLSLTSKAPPLKRLKFERWANGTIDSMKAQGAEEQKFGIKGYRGVKYGGVSFGHRSSDNHFVVKAEGEFTEFVAQAAIDAELDANCTRIDPAMNYRLDRPMQFYGEYLRQKIRAHDVRVGRTERTPFTLFEKALQDSGGTIGDRKSAIYPRIYDWALYHLGKSEMDIWRAEVEVKEEASERCWEQMKATTRRDKLCIDMVATRLDKHGIRPAGLKDVDPVPLVGTRPPSDIERWMKWFTGTVIPSMDNRAAQGHEQRIIEALRGAGWINEDGIFARDCET